MAMPKVQYTLSAGSFLFRLQGTFPVAEHFHQPHCVNDEGYQENQRHDAQEDILPGGGGGGCADKQCRPILHEEPGGQNQHKKQEKAHQDALGDMQADLIEAAYVIDERKEQNQENRPGQAGIIAHGHGKHARHREHKLDSHGDKQPLQAAGSQIIYGVFGVL